MSVVGPSNVWHPAEQLLSWPQLYPHSAWCQIGLLGPGRCRAVGRWRASVEAWNPAWRHRWRRMVARRNARRDLRRSPDASLAGHCRRPRRRALKMEAGPTIAGGACCAGVAKHRTLAAGEAVTAVDRLGARRPERDQGLAAAVRAGGAEHLARSTVATAMRAAGRLAASRLADGSTGGAAARLAELTVSVELLIAGRERELLIAVHAGQRLIGVRVQKKKLLLGRPQRPSRRER